MKRRLDYVTNSSSGSYVLQLYKEAPGTEGEDYYFLNKPIADCNFYSLCDIFFEFQGDIHENLCKQVYENGITPQIREKYFQLLLFQCFQRSAWGKRLPDENVISEVFDELEAKLRKEESLLDENDGKIEEYPILPQRGFINNIKYQWSAYFDFYEKKAILEYFNTQERSYKTLVKWFENITGCTWVLSDSWEGFGWPEGAVMGRKMDWGSSNLYE